MEIITEYNKLIEIPRDQIEIETDIKREWLGKYGKWERMDKPIGYVFYLEKGKLGRKVE